ncbi:gamma-glutamyltranspeptidase [Amanita rubescens]|nr:gamma-glutamyltranspeptidase [Amanita rubescens]
MKNILPVYSGPVPAPGAKRRIASTRSILIAISIVLIVLWLVHLVKARHGAVASQNKQCSEIGVNVLKRGGNAVDAAVSTVLCVGVVNIFFTGIGGGGFMTVRIPRGRGQKSEAWTIDFRETAPRLANSTMFIADPSLARSGEAHRRWGRLPWKKFVEPGIALAKGWRVGPELELRMQLNMDQAPFTRSGFALIYDRITLTSIRVASQIRALYRGRRVLTTKAPSSGSVLLHMLNIMEHFDFTDLNGLYRMVEAMKFGFSARTRICDPEFASCNLFENEISSKEYAAEAASNITDNRTHPSEYYRAEYDMKPDHGTSHTSIVDSSGTAVSVTTTVNLPFGSQVMDLETGVILSDEMDDFSIPGVPNAFGSWASPYNYPEPGKRSLSSTAPTIIDNPDGTLHLVVGGARIFPGVFQVILNVDRGMGNGQAIEHGRLHDQLYPSVLEVEDTYPSYLVEELRARGHNITG